MSQTAYGVAVQVIHRDSNATTFVGGFATYQDAQAALDTLKNELAGALCEISGAIVGPYILPIPDSGAGGSFSGGAVDQGAPALAANAWPVTLPNGVVVSNFPATQPVSATALPLPAGAATETTLALVKTLLQGSLSASVSGTVAVANFPATQPVSGTVAVSNPGLTDTQLRAAPVPVSGTFFQATQPVSGSVSVSNLPATQPVSGTVTATGPLTDTQLRAVPVPVSGSVSVSNLPATQPVSGTVAVSNFPATQPVSGTVTATGPLTDTQLRATAVPVSGTFFQVTQPVSGTVTATGPLTDTQLRATPVPVSGTVTASGPLTDTQLRAVAVPVSGTVTATGPLTDTQLRATAVPVSGTFFQATQPVSGTVTATGPLTDTQLRASAVPVSGTVTATGPLTDTQIRASALPVSGTFFQATQPVSVAAAVTVAQATAASLNVTNTPVAGASVSIGSSTGKANVLKTGALASSATTANQSILTYTVTSAKTFYLEYFDMIARLTTYAATATLFGTISLRIGGTAVYTTDLFHAGAMQPIQITLTEPIPVAAGVVVDVVCTPAASTAMSWKANFGGYEK